MNREPMLEEAIKWIKRQPTISNLGTAELMTSFAASVTQSQAATIAEQEKTIKRLTEELNQECGDYKELLDDSAVMAKDNIRLRGEVKRLRHIFEVIDVSYSGGPSTRAEHMLVVFNLVRKALSNDVGGESEE